MQTARQPARGVDGTSPPEFTTSEQLYQHYRKIKARLHGPAQKPVTIKRPGKWLVPVPPKVQRYDGEEAEESYHPEILPLPPVICLPSGPAGKLSRLDVLYAVAEAARLPVYDLRSHHRARPLVNARFVYYILARCYCDASLPQIGQTAGGRDHSTVLHGLRVGAERFRELYPIFREVCMKLCLPIPDVRRFLEYRK